MSRNLEAFYGYSILDDSESEKPVLDLAPLKKHIDAAGGLWTRLMNAAGRWTRSRAVTAGPDLEQLPSHLQRDVGVGPEMLGLALPPTGRAEVVESPRSVRTRLMAAWPQLQR